MEKLKNKLIILEKRNGREINYSLYKLNNLTEKSIDNEEMVNFKYTYSKFHSTKFLIIKPIHKHIHTPFEYDF